MLCRVLSTEYGQNLKDWLILIVAAIGQTPGWIPVGISTGDCVVDSSTGFWNRSNKRIPETMVYLFSQDRPIGHKTQKSMLCCLKEI